MKFEVLVNYIILFICGFCLVELARISYLEFKEGIENKIPIKKTVILIILSIIIPIFYVYLIFKILK